MGTRPAGSRPAQYNATGTAVAWNGLFRRQVGLEAREKFKAYDAELDPQPMANVYRGQVPASCARRAWARSIGQEA